MILAAIDPGSTHVGYAILRACPTGETLLASGTWAHRSAVPPVVRHVANCQAVATLLAAYAPTLVAYEEFRYRGGKDRVNPQAAQWIDRFIGYLLSLGGTTGVPGVIGLQASDWGKALFGQARHGKADIAWAVNCRLGTMFVGNSHDNHACDSVGIGLVAIDRWRVAHRDNSPLLEEGALCNHTTKSL